MRKRLHYIKYTIKYYGSRLDVKLTALKYYIQHVIKYRRKPKVMSRKSVDRLKKILEQEKSGRL